MDKVYGFTNENLASFTQIYEFNNASVLTVLGSGDQYFLAKLNQAQNVDVFDINYLTWYHFILKYTAIKVLSHEEFIQMFIKDNLDNQEIYNKISPYLPNEVKYFFDKLIKLNRKFSSIKIKNTIFKNTTKEYIPYLAKDKYYQLQNILKTSTLPHFYNYNLINLPNHLTSTYDIALLSNIYHYLPIDCQTYRKFLDTIPSQNILAFYTWILNKEEYNEFLANGFNITKVDSVINQKDYVITLKRHLK